jgi:hypothetical protein
MTEDFLACRDFLLVVVGLSTEMFVVCAEGRRVFG